MAYGEMTMTHSVKLQLGYRNSEQTRELIIEEPTTSDMEIKNRINALNASIAGGTSGGLDTFLRADDYNPNEQEQGTFDGIIAAQEIVIQSTEI